MQPGNPSSATIAAACPFQVGALVRHLCTDDAAAITGACLSIDGGWTAR